MINGIFYFRFGPGDFAVQNSYAPFQVGHGQGVEILPLQPGQRIIGPFRQIVIHVHQGNVDPQSQTVNKDTHSLMTFLCGAI